MAIAGRLFGGLPQVLHEENTRKKKSKQKCKRPQVFLSYHRLKTHCDCTARSLGDASAEDG